MRAPSRPFGPEWLLERLARLLPEFPDVPLCVALSGGIDSTALLAAMAAARGELSRGRTRQALRAIHVNHGLHENASRWSAHCRKLARQLDVPLKVFTVAVARERGASLEEAARTARYGCFAQHLRRGEALLSAHTQDDQLETVLLQLFRGSGLAGLSAMPQIAAFGPGWLVRPLLDCSREVLEDWLRAQGISWIEDDTNRDERFDRNYLRRSVLPLVRARWPGVARAVARTARHAAEAQVLLSALARADLERARDGASLSVPSLRALTPERRRNLVRSWIAASGRALPDARRLEEIVGPLINARPDAHPRVAWGDVVVTRHANVLSIEDRAAVLNPASITLTAAEAVAAPVDAQADTHADTQAQTQAHTQTHTPAEWRWRHSRRFALPGGGMIELAASSHGPVDLDALPERLSIGWRRGGERLRLRSGGPRRALKSLLQEARVPLAERTRMPLIFAEDRLIAAADLWIDESVRAAAGASHRARLVWHRSM